MLAALLGIAADQYGYVSAAQAVAAGCGAEQLRDLLSRGFLERRYHGVYRVFVAGSEPPEDPRGEAIAGLLALGPDSFACLDLAARLHGLQGLPRWTRTSQIHVGIPASSRTRRRRDSRLRVHSWQIPAQDVTVRWGLRLTTVSRTLRDLARRLDREEFVCVLDSALYRRKISAVDAVALNDTDLGRKGARRFRAWWALADARGRSMSPLETRIRLVAADHGLAPDELQHRFTRDGEHVATVSLWWRGPPELVVEADEHAAPEPPCGVDQQRPGRGQEHPVWTGSRTGPWEMSPFVFDRRHNRLRLLFPEVRILRFTWADLRHPQRIAAEIRAVLNGWPPP